MDFPISNIPMGLGAYKEANQNGLVDIVNCFPKLRSVMFGVSWTGLKGRP